MGTSDSKVCETNPESHYSLIEPSKTTSTATPSVGEFNAIIKNNNMSEVDKQIEFIRWIQKYFECTPNTAVLVHHLRTNRMINANASRLSDGQIEFSFRIWDSASDNTKICKLLLGHTL